MYTYGRIVEDMIMVQYFGKTFGELNFDHDADVWIVTYKEETLPNIKIRNLKDAQRFIENKHQTEMYGEIDGC